MRRTARALLAATLLLAGCASLAPLPVLEPGAPTATVTVLWEPMVAIGRQTVTLDGADIVALAQGEHATLTLPTGDHTFGLRTLGMDIEIVMLTLVPGGRYYLRIVAVPFEWPRLRQISAASAEPLLRTTVEGGR